MKTAATQTQTNRKPPCSSDAPKAIGSNAISKGRILRVKQGYNPNSSSMGSIVFVLPAALLGITAVFGAVSGAIMAAFLNGADPGKSPVKDASAKAETTEEPR